MSLSSTLDPCPSNGLLVMRKSRFARDVCALRHTEFNAMCHRHCKFLLRDGKSFNMNSVSFRRFGYNSKSCIVKCEAQSKLLSNRSDIFWNKRMHLKEEDIHGVKAKENFIWVPKNTVMIDLKPIHNSIFHDDGIEMGKHYEEMIGEDPRNPMLLRNYGQYLLKFKGDLLGAEKCYLHALLLDPDNGQLLAEYAAITWQLYRTESIAKYFFERAVESSPDDSFVHAAYARFLFQNQDEEDED